MKGKALGGWSVNRGSFVSSGPPVIRSKPSLGHQGNPKPFSARCVRFAVAATITLLTLMGRVGVFALAVLFAALPVMACAVPDAAMTPAERDCCKKMARQCGDMGMAKSHPCCQSTATPADFHALKTASSQVHHVTWVLSHSLPVASQAGAYCSLAQWSSRVSCTHSPPGLGSTTTTILRI